MTDRDRRIHEQIIGKCWHDIPPYIDLDHHVSYPCSKCGETLSSLDAAIWILKKASYLSWEHYGPMLQKLQEHERYGDFILALFFEWERKASTNEGSIEFGKWLSKLLSNPERGCEAVVKFFCKEK